MALINTPSLGDVNLSALSPITTAATALSNLILVSPQATQGYQPNNPAKNPNAKQPPSLLFHYEGENTVELASDITDHYVEDNTAIQDQWALRPEKITVHGFIGELNDIPPKALQLVQQAAQKLTTIGAYVPSLSETALIAYNEAFFLYQVGANAVNSGVSAWSSITGSQNGENVIGSAGIGVQVNLNTATVNNSQTKQQIAFQQFYAYWRARWLFTVQTPWAVFQNMAIENLRAVQDETTRMITDFYIQFKMIRTAQSITNSLNLTPLLQGTLANQAAAPVNLGNTTPAPSISVSQGLSNMGAVA